MSKKNTVTIKSIVEEVMRGSLASRNDDSVLYAMVCERLNDNVKRYSFSDVMHNRIYFGLPTYETVRCTRNDIVAQHKELDCLPGVRDKRGKRKRTYLDYAKI